MRMLGLAVVVALVCGAPACTDDVARRDPVSGAAAAPQTTTTAAPVDAGTEPCPGPVPAALGLDPFYDHHCDVLGIPLVADAAVDPEAMRIAAEFTRALLAARPDIAGAIAATDVRIGVIGRDQLVTHMPEWSDLYEAFPDTDWDHRSRGLGATKMRPLAGAAEENLLCLRTDPYRGESIFVHELAHVIHEFGAAMVDPGFDVRLSAAYDEAVAAGLWAGTYAETNPFEYWAEGVQSFFDTNLADDFQHNAVDTRAELAVHDPALYALIVEVFGEPDWRPTCP